MAGVDEIVFDASATCSRRARSAACSRPTRSRGCAAAPSRGAANNQLGTIAAGDALAARGVAYAADFVVNAGGIINIAEEFGGYDAERAARAHARHRADDRPRVRAGARARTISPARAAEALARERIAAIAPLANRRRPGDRTAWTQGRGLERLRGT